MEYKVTEKNNITLIEVMKNGKVVSRDNPVEVSELKAALTQLETGGGKICLVSGMPGWATSAALQKIKNIYQVSGLYDPKSGGAIVTSTTNSDYPVGAIIPLE